MRSLSNGRSLPTRRALVARTLSPRLHTLKLMTARWLLQLATSSASLLRRPQLLVTERLAVVRLREETLLLGVRQREVLVLPSAALCRLTPPLPVASSRVDAPQGLPHLLLKALLGRRLCVEETQRHCARGIPVAVVLPLDVA